MNTATIIIAIGTFAGLAFIPMQFTAAESNFRRINKIAGFVLCLLMAPCLYFDMGYALLIVVWAACWLLSALSHMDLSRKTFDEEVPFNMDLVDLPKISAKEKIQNLERLARLKSSGMISPDEFNSEKKNFLG